MSAARLALLAALGAFLGHLFPVWLDFKGGKGVATYIGILLGAGLAGRARLLPDLARGRGAHPLLLARRADRERRDAVFALGARQAAEARLFALLTVLLWIMHRANIARLINGTEGKIGKPAASGA